MIYKFRILSSEVKDFARELLISSTQSFLDFHHCLQENLGYDPKQLSSFFITNERWEKKLQITLIDMMDEEDENVLIMEKELVGNHLNEIGDRSLYVFDFFSERSFFIELTEILNLESNKKVPGVIFAHGDPPEQINLGLDNMDFNPEELDDDISGSSFDDSFGEDMDYYDEDDFPED